MALVKYNPFRGFEGIIKRMNDLMSDFDRDSFFDNNLLGSRTFLPAVDIKEDEKYIYINAELPGMKKDDIKVTINDENVLQIKGTKKYEDKKEDETYIRMERSFGEFVRSFTLPENVKEDTIKAKYEDGILQISLEKTEPSKPKEIEIKVK